MNLLKTEILQQYSLSTANESIGEVVSRNGANAYKLAPNKYYSNSIYNHIGKGLFIEGVYVFDLWIDADDVVYQDVNRLGGVVISYTDGTTSNATVKGDKTNPKGFQHTVFKSDPNKTIDGYYIYYSTAMPIYIRLDSFIAPHSVASLNSTTKGNLFVESTNPSIVGGGTLKANEINEV